MVNEKEQNPDQEKEENNAPDKATKPDDAKTPAEKNIDLSDDSEKAAQSPEFTEPVDPVKIAQEAQSNGEPAAPIKTEEPGILPQSEKNDDTTVTDNSGEPDSSSVQSEPLVSEPEPAADAAGAAEEAVIADEKTISDAPASNAVEEEVPKKKHNYLRDVLITTGVLLIIAAICIYLGSIKTKASEAAENTFKAICSQNSEIYNVMDKIDSKGGMVDFNADLTKLIGTEDNTSISAKLYGDKKSVFGNFAFTVNGKKISADIYKNEKGLAASSEELTESKVYGVGFEDILKNLDSSVFAPGSGTEWALDEDQFKSLKNFVDNYVKNIKDDPKETYSDIFDIISKIADKNFETTESKEKVIIGSDSVKADCYKTEITKDKLLSFIDDLKSEINGDTELRGLVLKIARNFNLDPETSEIKDDDDLIKSISDALTELSNLLKDAEINLTVNSYVKGKYLCLFTLKGTVSYEGEEVQIEIKADFGKNPEDSTVQTIEITAGAQGVSTTVSIKREVTENSNKKFASETTVTVLGSKIAVKFDWNKENNDFKLSATVPTVGKYEISGKLKADKSKINLEINKLSASGQNSEEIDLDIKAVIEAGADIPKMPEYTDILKMNESDFKKMIDEIKSKGEDLSKMFEGLNGLNGFEDEIDDGILYDENINNDLFEGDI